MWWRRIKLMIAEGLVLGVAGHGMGFHHAEEVIRIAREIRKFRERYYPEQR